MRRGVEVALLGALVLGACTTMSDAEYFSRQWARERDTAIARQAPPPGMRVATPAENACLNAAVAEGYRVVRLASTTEVAGPDGRPVAQLLVLEVARGDGPVTAWRCTYDLASGRLTV